MLKCTFFLKVLSLRLMSLEDCDNLPESSDENVCVGQRENLLLQAAIKYQSKWSDELLTLLLQGDSKYRLIDFLRRFRTTTVKSLKSSKI